MTSSQDTSMGTQVNSIWQAEGIMSFVQYFFTHTTFPADYSLEKWVSQVTHVVVFSLAH